MVLSSVERGGFTRAERIRAHNDPKRQSTILIMLNAACTVTYKCRGHSSHGVPSRDFAKIWRDLAGEMVAALPSSTESRRACCSSDMAVGNKFFGTNELMPCIVKWTLTAQWIHSKRPATAACGHRPYLQRVAPFSNFETNRNQSRRQGGALPWGHYAGIRCKHGRVDLGVACCCGCSAELGLTTVILQCKLCLLNQN